MQIEPTAHFHPQLASKAEKVFPIPLNRKTLFRYFKAIIISLTLTGHQISLTLTEPTFRQQVDALSRQMDQCADRKRLVSQPVFKEFLLSNAPTLYNNILDSILSERHGEKRANLQEKRATALIWQLLYYRYCSVKNNSML